MLLVSFEAPSDSESRWRREHGRSIPFPENADMTGNRTGGKKQGNGGSNDSQTDSDVPRRPQDERRNDQKWRGTNFNA